MFLAVFVISFGLVFLSFTKFLLLKLPVVPCFFSSCFFILVSTPIFLYKRIWAFGGQIMLTGSKRSWAQFVFIYRRHSARELYSAAKLYFVANRFPCIYFFRLLLLFGLLGGPLGHAFHWAFLYMGFWVRIKKLALTHGFLKQLQVGFQKREEEGGGRRWGVIKAGRKLKKVYIFLCVCVWRENK